MNTIIGIDPGSRFLGFGVLSWDPTSSCRYIAHGVIKVSPSLSFPRRLLGLRDELETLFQKYPPSVVVVEKIFVGKNVESAFKLGHVRGVCLAQAVAHKASIFEYAPRVIKKMVAGNGGASKEQVRWTLHQWMGVGLDAEIDATDALAMAYCYTRKAQEDHLIRQAEERIGL